MKRTGGGGGGTAGEEFKLAGGKREGVQSKLGGKLNWGGWVWCKVGK